jgi:SAM-dependent methyltransferase
MHSVRRLFDQQLLRTRQRRALTLGATTFLLDRIADELAERLAAVVRRFDVAADLGTPGDAVRRALAAQGSLPATFVAVHPLATYLPGGGPAVAADLEALPFRDGSLDLAVSALALQWADDLPGTLTQIRRTLKPDGLFLAAMLGGETLTELRHSMTEAESEMVGGVAPRVVPFADIRALGALLQRAGFSLPVSDLDRLTVRYDSVFPLINDLRRMGATNVLIERNRRPLRKSTLMRLADIYTRRFSDADGRVRATFDVVWLSGWAPHVSQQQPMRPGTASDRLADALNTRELPAGEKAGR